MPFGMGAASWAYISFYAYPYARLPYPLWPLVWILASLEIDAWVSGDDPLYLAMDSHAQRARDCYD